MTLPSRRLSAGAPRSISLVVEQINPLTSGTNAIYEYVPGHVSFSEFIFAYPRGAYTGMRTVGRNAIVEYDSHCKRITSSLSQMTFAEHEGAHESLTVTEHMKSFRDEALFAEKFPCLLHAALHRYYDTLVPSDSEALMEAKVSVVVSYSFETQQPRFAAHVTPLHRPVNDRVKVEVEYKTRACPSVKDSQWVHDRESLEQNKPKDVNEVVLADKDGHLYEGMASNFFAVMQNDDGASYLVCASLDHVLLGTVMKLVVAICQEHDIDIRWEFPRLDDAQQGRWQGCFLTSTSRLLLPIETMHFKDQSPPIDFPQLPPIIDFLKHKVEEEISRRARKIL